MNQYCSRCKKSLKTTITLICDHQICLNCAQALKIPEGIPPLDAKFRLICPRCQKSTLTHNIENLIAQESDKFLFDNLESSELNESSLGQVIPNDPQKPTFTERQLKQMSYSQRFSNIWAERKTPDITEKGSKASNDSRKYQTNKNSRSSSRAQNSFAPQCYLHKEHLMFFCEQEQKVMCQQCLYKHTREHKSHKICHIKDALLTIQIQNKHFKQDARKRIEEIDKYVAVCKSNHGKIDQAYEIHQQLIEKEFKELEVLIKEKKNDTLEYLERAFAKKQKDVNTQLSDFAYLKNCLKEHYQFPLENDQSEIYFFNAYSIMRDAISKDSIKIKQFQKEELACFEKLCSTQDFQLLLDKFLKPKRDGRESKAQSCKNSELGEKAPEKSKAILYDEYKHAKKALDKINKMEKSHKTTKDKNYNYLNNYVIGIQKKYNQSDKGAGIRERKSSTGVINHNGQKHFGKALTPTRLLSSKGRKK